MTTEVKATGVAILLLKGKGVLMYLRDSNPNIKNGLRWAFPDGIVAEGQTPYDAADDCLERKFGIPKLRDRLSYLGTTKRGTALFTANVFETSPLPQLRPGEGIAVAMFTEQALDEYIARNYEEPLDIVNAAEVFREQIRALLNA